MSTTMEITREDLNPCTIKLTVKCTPEQVQTGFNRAYKLFSEKMRVPGFRPGHAPKKVLEPMINKQDLYNQAADEIVKSAIQAAIKQEKIEPNDSPVVEITELNEDENACAFTAKVPLRPVVELGAYKGIEVKAPAVEVTDEEIEKQLAELQKRAGKRESVTGRGVETGDMVLVNLKVEGSDDEGHNFMSVAGETFKTLDAAMLGMHAEEIKMVELTFPKDFSRTEWAGKKKKTQITIRSLSNVQLPELTDDFAKEAVGKALKSESLSELKEKLKERFTQAKQAMNDEFVQESIQEQILSASNVHVPDTMWESVANQRLREEQASAQKEGKTLEAVAQENGMTLDEFVQKWQDEAKVQVRRAVVTNKIFEEEKMKLTQEDYNQAIITMAQEVNADPRALFEYLRKHNALFEVEVRARYRRVMDFLRSNAKIVSA